MKKEKSCGCIIVNDNKVLLVYEKNRNFWGFPKGHMELGETEIETAKREVKEEVGLDVDINIKKRYELVYNIDNIVEKTTILFLAIPKNDKIVMQESEIENTKWCNFDEAIELLTYENWKDVLRKAIKEL